MSRRQPGPSSLRTAVARARIAPAVRAAANEARIGQILAGASRDIFSLDLSDPASHPAAEAFLAGRLTALTAMGVDPRGWVR